MTDHTLLDEQQKKLKGVPKRKQLTRLTTNKDVNKSGDTASCVYFITQLPIKKYAPQNHKRLRCTILYWCVRKRYQSCFHLIGQLFGILFRNINNLSSRKSWTENRSFEQDVKGHIKV